MLKKSFFILYDFDQTAGGGKSFLSSFRDYLLAKKQYADNAESSDIIILNSHNHLEEAQRLKVKFNGQKTFVHRIDGPMRTYNQWYDVRDFTVQYVLDFISDCAIFQSKWSLKNHTFLYGDPKVPVAVIHNAANMNFFYPGEKTQTGKIKIIGSAWSHQKNKGGDYYDYLEENLDFNRFEMSFVGKTIGRYSKIKCLGILDQKQLGEELKKNHIYFFPSLYEACSNALLEGIASGLIPMVRAGSSNLEVVEDSRLQFSSYSEAIIKLNRINLSESYQFKNPDFNHIAQQYIDFASAIKPQYRELNFNVHKLHLNLKNYSYKIARLLHRVTEPPKKS